MSTDHQQAAAAWLSERGIAAPPTGGADAEADRPGPDADPEADPYVVARTIALRKLTVQARTRHELDQALQAKNVPEQAAREVLDRLTEVGLVDDATYAVDWVASRQRRRHLSRSALKRELGAKGVSREDIDAALQTVDADAEFASALDLARRKQAQMAGLGSRGPVPAVGGSARSSGLRLGDDEPGAGCRAGCAVSRAAAAVPRFSWSVGMLDRTQVQTYPSGTRDQQRCSILIYKPPSSHSDLPKS